MNSFEKLPTIKRLTVSEQTQDKPKNMFSSFIQMGNRVEEVRDPGFDEQVKLLIDMGFEKAKAEKALSDNNMEFDRAMETLL
jgi:hypothetical protein